MKMNRRFLLRGTALAAFGATLAACSLTAAQLSAAITTASSDASLIASSFKALVPTLTTLGIPAGTVATVSSTVATVVNDANVIATAVAANTAPATTLVQEYATAANATISTLLPLLNISSTQTVVIQAAVSLLPTILAAFGISAATPAHAVMSPAAARLILAAHR